MSNELTQERVKELFDYDPENGWLIRKTIRNGCPYNKPCGHKPSSEGYGRIGIDGNIYHAHRIIWLWHKGEWTEYELDHIDRDRMNNRIDNLRPATRSENSHNIGMNSRNTSGYPGVCFHKASDKYVAHIVVNGKQIYLGLFNTPEEAFLHYQLAKIELHPTSPIAQQYLRELTLAG